MSSISSLGSDSPSLAGLTRQQPSDDRILAKVEKDFGADGVAAVTDDNGKLDKTKLQAFLKSKGVAQGQAGAQASAHGAPPAGGGQGGGANNSSSGTSNASADAPTTIKSQARQTNANGSVTTTITYDDGTVKTTTSAPDATKASDAYRRGHPEKDTKKSTVADSRDGHVSITA